MSVVGWGSSADVRTGAQVQESKGKGSAYRGIARKLGQDLARHSTITLTMDHYSHTLHAERAAALDTLPDLAGEPKQMASRAG